MTNRLLVTGFIGFRATVFAVVASAVLVALGACSSGGERPKPAELPVSPNLLSAQQAWTQRVGEVGFSLRIAVNGDTVTVASTDGTVAAISAQQGTDLWRSQVGERLQAGVGSDGKTAAVVTVSNELVVIEQGRTLWRQQLQSQSYTAPLVAGERVFVLGADRSVTGFDGATGAKLWSYSRTGEALVLRQAGVLQAMGDTLVAGVAGRLIGLNPSNGSVRWEVPVGSSRGTNDVERLVDIVHGSARVGAQLCVRAFQSSVGCVNAVRGQSQWSRPANGSQGISSDNTQVYGTEANGTVMAYNRETGDRVWSTERLQYRDLSAPLAAGRSIAIGDGTGFVHLLSREDGSLLTRLTTDGSAIVAGPTLAGTTLIVATRQGGVFAFRPQ